MGKLPPLPFSAPGRPQGIQPARAALTVLTPTWAVSPPPGTPTIVCRDPFERDLARRTVGAAA